MAVEKPLLSIPEEPSRVSGLDCTAERGGRWVDEDVAY